MAKTIDERLDALTHGLEELKEFVGRLVALAERTDQRTNAILDGIQQLADVAHSHERRLNYLEGGKGIQ